MERAAIIIEEHPNIKDISTYKVLIGVEHGSKFVLENEDKLDTYHVGDFDSVEEEFKVEMVDRKNCFYIPDELKAYCDGEEAIIKAKELGYTNIDIYVDINGRPDHLLNMIRVARKYSANIYSKDGIINVVNGKKTLKKEHDYISLFFFEETNIKTEGLKWDVDRIYDIESGTNCISNRIEEDSFIIETDKKVVVFQAKEKEA